MEAYLIRGGTVLDGTGAPAQEADIRIENGLITQIGAELEAGELPIIDAKGYYVTPGLIDLHAHVFDGTGIWSIPAEQCGLPKGVTTLLDTGSAGSLTAQTFEKYVVPTAREEIYALLNISMLGCLQGHYDAKPVMGELADKRYINVEAAVEYLEKHRPFFIGMKARLTGLLADDKEEHERLAFDGALQAAEQTGTFLMVHHAVSNIPVRELLERLRPGDIYTHLYHPYADRAFEADGKPLVEMLEAQKRGVIFDVGHGAGAFSWDVAQAACQNYGFWPDTISTDIHAYNLNGPVWDMATTLTKFLALGMPLEKVIQAGTLNPAKAMRLDNRLGSLEVGKQADIAFVQIEEGHFPLYDVLGHSRDSSQRLVVKGVAKKGHFTWLN